MLYDIAKLYDGMFAYIPDAQNLGTTFVNGIANIMTTYANNVWLKLDFKGNLKIKDLHVGDIQFRMNIKKN